MSNDEGNGRIVWQVIDGTLRLRWREQGGPTVVEPRRTGFGSRLIDRGLGRGVVSRRYPQDGVEVDLDVSIQVLLDG